MKKAQQHIPFLDHIRAVAILLVFLFHSLDASYRSDHFLFNGWFRNFSSGPLPFFLAPLTFGYLGVAIFFVVSGFCIHLSHEGSREKSFSTFYLRRFFRIYPPYLAALLIFALVFPTTRLSLHSQFSANLYQLITHLFLVYNFDSVTYHGINPAFWSIAVEVQLYLLYPLLLWFTRKWGWYRALWITGGIEVGMRVILGAFPHASSFKPFIPGIPFLYWYSWAIGAALAESYLKKQPLPFARFHILFWPAVTVVACLFEPLYPFSFLFAALSTACFISFMLNRPVAAPVAAGPFGFIWEYLRFIGLISYSVYLIHQPIVEAVPKVLHRLFPQHIFSGLVLYTMCLVAWILITALSYAFYRLIELPSVELGKWFNQKKRTDPDIIIPSLPAVNSQ